MPFDFALTPDGDWKLSANGDYEAVYGPAQTGQRIIIRCKIPRGSYIYDRTGTLGSNLDLNPRNISIQQASLKIPEQVFEALAPMQDVEIVSVDVAEHQDDPNALAVYVRYKPAPESDAELFQDDVTDPEFEIEPYTEAQHLAEEEFGILFPLTT